MRITQSIITRTFLENLNKTQENLYTYQKEVSTGKSIHNPSDDPVGFSKASRFKEAINQNEQFLRNIDNADGWLTTTITALDDMYSKIVDTKEIAIRATGLEYSEENQRILAEQVDNALKDVVALANTTYLNKYIFAGSKTQGEKPFVVSEDGSITYTGNEKDIKRKISKNVDITINVKGDQLRDTGLFSSISDLKDALNNNDIDAINSSIDTLETVANEILSLSSGMGSVKNYLDMMSQRLETANLNLSSLLSRIEDTDLAEAITKYNSEELAYRAALQTASQTVQLNLFDFLG